MLDDQVVDPGLHGRSEGVVGGAQIGELGLAADGWHDVREQHRSAPGFWRNEASECQSWLPSASSRR